MSAPARALDHERRARRPGLGGAVAAYVALTKPRIIELLLVTTVPAMVLAEEGLPTLWLVAATLIGGTLAAGGANAINQYVDRDIDEVMRRTRRRPLPSHRCRRRGRWRSGSRSGSAGFVWLAVFVNLLSAALATAGLLFYVFVYTLWLKRRSVQNIVVGGAAGAVPALVGWAAVTGRVGWPAVVLFVVVFLWTPPHFWALALRYERDYAAAGVPMLPVVAGTSATIRQILLYAVATVAASLVLVPVAGMGWVYVASAVGLGAWFLVGGGPGPNQADPARGDGAVPVVDQLPGPAVPRRGRRRPRPRRQPDATEAIEPRLAGGRQGGDMVTRGPGLDPPRPTTDAHGRGMSRRRICLTGGLLAVVAIFLASCASNAPQDSLDPAGPYARQIDALFRPVFWIATAVFVLVEGLIVVAVIRFRDRGEDDDRVPEQVHGNRRLEIMWTIAPAVLLAAIAVPTIATIFSLDAKPAGALDVRVVIGHQFWFEVQYPDMDVVTANEMHIPVGQPVYVTIESVDVIHSFWVPRLAGKQDVVPGSVHHLKIEADEPGLYEGQCAEYCGESHANMQFAVVAQTPADFQTWVAGRAAAGRASLRRTSSPR